MSTPRERFVEAMQYLVGYIGEDQASATERLRAACDAFADVSHDERFHSVAKTCGATCHANDPERLALLRDCGLEETKP